MILWPRRSRPCRRRDPFYTLVLYIMCTKYSNSCWGVTLPLFDWYNWYIIPYDTAIIIIRRIKTWTKTQKRDATTPLGRSSTVQQAYQSTCSTAPHRYALPCCSLGFMFKALWRHGFLWEFLQKAKSREAAEDRYTWSLDRQRKRFWIDSQIHSASPWQRPYLG